MSAASGVEVDDVLVAHLSSGVWRALLGARGFGRRRSPAPFAASQLIETAHAFTMPFTPAGVSLESWLCCERRCKREQAVHPRPPLARLHVTPTQCVRSVYRLSSITWTCWLLLQPAVHWSEDAGHVDLWMLRTSLLLERQSRTVQDTPLRSYMTHAQAHSRVWYKYTHLVPHFFFSHGDAIGDHNGHRRAVLQLAV